MVVLQETAQPLAAADLSLGEAVSALNELVADPLVGAFGVVVVKVRLDRPTQGASPKKIILRRHSDLIIGQP